MECAATDGSSAARFFSQRASGRAPLWLYYPLDSATGSGMTVDMTVSMLGLTSYLRGREGV